MRRRSLWTRVSVTHRAFDVDTRHFRTTWLLHSLPYRSRVSGLLSDNLQLLLLFDAKPSRGRSHVCVQGSAYSFRDQSRLSSEVRVAVQTTKHTTLLHRRLEVRLLSVDLLHHCLYPLKRPVLNLLVRVFLLSALFAVR